jgi:hypothetical protein
LAQAKYGMAKGVACGVASGVKRGSSVESVMFVGVAIVPFELMALMGLMLALVGVMELMLVLA